MENVIKAIYKWQVEAGLASQEYSDFLESSFQIEEALEGFYESELPEFLLPSLSSGLTPKQYSRCIMEAITSENKIVSDVDRFDKAINAIVFAIGSMAKLGLTPQQMTKGILAVNKANMQKLGMPIDEHGKKIKPKDFVGPEVELQKILNERV